MVTAFHTTLEIKDQACGEHVRLKPDGERFPEGSPNTIKFNVAHTYTLTVTFHPPKVLRYWTIRGEKLEFDRIKPRKNDDEVTIYETQWPSTAATVTKRGERSYLPIELELDNSVILKLSLQAKFYPAKETTHCKWGQELHAIEYKCQVPDGQTFVDILSQKTY